MSSSLASPENLIEASVNVCNSTVVQDHSKNISSKKTRIKDITTEKKQKNTWQWKKAPRIIRRCISYCKIGIFPGKTLTRNFRPQESNLSQPSNRRKPKTRLVSACSLGPHHVARPPFRNDWWVDHARRCEHQHLEKWSQNDGPWKR